MPTSRATTCIAALCGGSNLATALSLNACPYRATVFLHCRYRVYGFMEATTILTRGGEHINLTGAYSCRATLSVWITAVHVYTS